jgi:hypothetical protein
MVLSSCLNRSAYFQNARGEHGGPREVIRHGAAFLLERILYGNGRDLFTKG